MHLRQANFRDAAPGGDFPPYEGLSGNGLFSDIMTSRLSLKEVEQAVYELVSRLGRVQNPSKNSLKPA